MKKVQTHVRIKIVNALMCPLNQDIKLQNGHTNYNNLNMFPCFALRHLNTDLACMAYRKEQRIFLQTQLHWGHYSHIQ